MSECNTARLINEDKGVSRNTDGANVLATVVADAVGTPPEGEHQPLALSGDIKMAVAQIVSAITTAAGLHLGAGTLCYCCSSKNQDGQSILALALPTRDSKSPE